MEKICSAWIAVSVLSFAAILQKQRDVRLSRFSHCCLSSSQCSYEKTQFNLEVAFSASEFVSRICKAIFRPQFLPNRNMWFINSSENMKITMIAACSFSHDGRVLQANNSIPTNLQISRKFLHINIGHQHWLCEKMSQIRFVAWTSRDWWELCERILTLHLTWWPRCLPSVRGLLGRF